MPTGGGMYISQIKQLQDRVFNRLLAARGIDISGAAGRILFVLWQQGDCTMGEIAAHTSLAVNTLTTAVDNLVQKGLAVRAQNPSNRRQVVVTLTQRALDARAEYEAVSAEMGGIFYAGFVPGEIAQLEGYLSRLLQNLKDAEENI